MKVTQQVEAFQPVNILFETEAEIKFFANLVSCSTGSVSEVACGDREMCFKVWEAISKYATDNIESKIHITTI